MSDTSAGRKLLDLAAEYRASTEARGEDYAVFDGAPTGRDTDVIAAEYVAALRSLITGSLR